MHLDIGNTEIGVRFCSQAGHSVTMVCLGNLGSLERRTAGRDKDDPVKTEQVSHLFSNAQMSVMNRVEGAAEYAEIHPVYPRIIEFAIALMQINYKSGGV
jgi:hypothetical protein